MSVIALDLGGTKLASGIFSLNGQLSNYTTTLLLDKKGIEVGHLISAHIEKLLTLAKENKVKIEGIGISIPGIAHKDGTVWAPNIPGWEKFDLRKQIKKTIGPQKISIKIADDRSCYILGEVWKGNAKNCTDAIYLSVGTGIGAGILANDQIISGKHGIAGAIGWLGLSQPYHTKYKSCGDFEYHASGSGLVHRAKALLKSKKYQHSALSKLNEDRLLSTNTLFEYYHKKDILALKLLNDAVTYWGMAIANLVSIFNPEKIILGGGVFGPAVEFIPQILHEAKKWAQPISIHQVTIIGSKLQAKAGLYGAAYLILKKKKSVVSQ